MISRKLKAQNRHNLNVKDFLYIENALDRDLIEEMSSDKIRKVFLETHRFNRIQGYLYSNLLPKNEFEP
jgi:virulence-associated protein VapD